MDTVINWWRPYCVQLSKSVIDFPSPPAPLPEGEGSVAEPAVFSPLPLGEGPGVRVKIR